jgi:hypothetical protein
VSVAGKNHLQRLVDHGLDNGCCVCGEPFAHIHHILEGRTPGRKAGDFCTVPLCWECHLGAGGIHGTRQRWTLRKMDELKALDKTLEAVYG